MDKHIFLIVLPFVILIAVETHEILWFVPAPLVPITILAFMSTLVLFIALFIMAVILTRTVKRNEKTRDQ